MNFNIKEAKLFKYLITRSIMNKKSLFHFKIKYFVAFILLFLIEGLITVYIHDDFIRPFVGDMIVIALLYTFLKSFINIRTPLLPFYLFLFAFSVELMQGIGVIYIFGLDEYKLAKIIIGTSYSNHDVLCYAIGSGALILWERRKTEFSLALITSNIVIFLFGIEYFLSQIGIPILIRIFILLLVVIGLMIGYVIIHIKPDFDLDCPMPGLAILIGGRSLIRISYGVLLINTLWLVFFGDITRGLFKDSILNEGKWGFTISVSLNYIIGLLIILSYYINGYVRVLLTSHRISPLKRILAIVFMFIPPVQLYFSNYLSKAAEIEFDHECNKMNLDKIRVESEICKTKYPLLMLHGVGFKDYKYVNYWGRIPRELIKHGSKVYYGHQEAWGTIEDNAEEIKKKIFEVMEKENCEKVNIIAHSKGGLDGRYVVSKLGMGAYVASLTMIGSPHKGSEVLELVEKLPAKLVTMIGNMINRHFKLLGDKGPNFHIASKQFLIENSKSFNKQVKDDSRVYYQSYAAEMKTPFGDLLLCIPYLIVRIMGGKNDGLVTEESAKWGDYKGLVLNKYHRGISHGDMIDLKREDYEGFDVREFYVQMVRDLKNEGY